MFWNKHFDDSCLLTWKISILKKEKSVGLTTYCASTNIFTALNNFFHYPFVNLALEIIGF